MISIDFSAFNSRKAFTLVEIIVVLATITILTGVGMATTTKYQQSARDSERESKANIIATSLEKFYDENNEYPSCTALTAAPATVKSATLKGLANEDALRAPRAPSGTNSLQCSSNAPSGTDKFTYTCLSTSACEKWELRFRNESDGSVKTIASIHSGINGSATLDGPNVDVSTQISGQDAIGTATATCQSGTPQYQMHAYKNTGSFPAWSSGSSTTVTPVNEGESATFQAQAQCTLSGLSPSDWVQSDPKTASRPVTAPTGLATSNTISGANAIGSASGGSCATGTTLQRQMENGQTYHPWVFPTWSGYVDTSSQTVPVNEGWLMSFHHQARCVNSTTGVASNWSAGPNGDAARPISTLGAPLVSATGNENSISYSWGGAACPTGTNKEYRWYLTREGYQSDWWGPSSGTTFDWNDNSDGYTFGAYVQQRCSTYYATGAWSASGYGAWTRGVSPPGGPSGFTVDKAGTGGIAFGWTAPSCDWGAQGEWRADFVNGGGTGIAWINPPSGHADYWWYGGRSQAISSAVPSTGWSTGWPNYGYMGDRNNAYSVSPPRMNLDVGTNGAFDPDNIIGIAVEYRCRNPDTGRASTVGAQGGRTYTW